MDKIVNVLIQYYDVESGKVVIEHFAQGKKILQPQAIYSMT